MEIDPKAVGARIRERREALRLVQEDLARAAKVRGLAISELELGKTENPKTMTIASIAETLGVTVDWILYGARSAEPTIDPTEADDFPLSTDELMHQAAKLVGLSPDQTRAFFAERRRGGMPYSLELLIGIARGYAQAAKVPDRSQVDAVVDPEGVVAPRLPAKKKGRATDVR